MGTNLFNKDIKLSELYSLIKGLNIDNEQEINILLLGETGIGKSTFINALANYLTYKKLKDVEKEKLMVLIPSKFTITDKEFKEHCITTKVEGDKNEDLEVGVSATQDVKTYIFPLASGKTKLRIIDSPGIGDTRGPQQDKINCENILSYLGQLEKLHAICCMFSTTNSRITVFFDYCFKEILSRLDKTASNNLIFIFTNTRAAYFTPGDTMTLLRNLISDVEKQQPGAKIPFDNKNIFCFENDCFKYLAARKQSVEFDDSVRKLYKESWEQSCKESWRLIGYIVGDNSSKPLQPHDIRNTISINEARRLIVNLSQPLADISQMIQDNIMTLERHKGFLESHTNSIEEMKKKLYIPFINLKVTNLSQPVTVCTSNKCIEIYRVEEIKKQHYRQRCHDPCYLSKVPKEIIGTPELAECASMDSTGSCKKCTCHFTAHMHVYYLTETVSDTAIDNAIQENIRTREDAFNKTRQVIGNIEKRKSEFEEERKKIVTYTAQFAHFLQNNAIAPYNDSYENYIQCMIDREKLLGKLADQANIDQMKYLLEQYKETKRSYETALRYKKQLEGAGACKLITSETILKSINALYGLKHTGKKIKEMVDSQKTARTREYDQTSEYIHASSGNMFKNWGNNLASNKNTYTENSNERKSNDTNTKGRQERFNNNRGRGNWQSRGNYKPHNSQNRNEHNFNYQRQNTRGSYQHPTNYNQSTALPPYQLLPQSYQQPFSRQPSYQQPFSQQPHSSTYNGNQRLPTVEVNLYQTPKCGNNSCRDPQCSGIVNQQTSCGDPFCQIPNCQSTFTANTNSPMGNNYNEYANRQYYNQNYPPHSAPYNQHMHQPHNQQYSYGQQNSFHHPRRDYNRNVSGYQSGSLEGGRRNRVNSCSREYRFKKDESKTNKSGYQSGSSDGGRRNRGNSHPREYKFKKDESKTNKNKNVKEESSDSSSSDSDIN